MAWFLYSGADNVYMGANEGGTLKAWGNATHESHPEVGKLRAAGASWSLVSCSAPDGDIDGAGCGLLQRVRAAPEQSHYAVQFHEEEPSLVGVKIALPEQHHGAALNLVRTVLTHPGVALNITLSGFLGFRAPGGTGPTPTLEQFVSGTPLFGGEVSFIIGRQFADRAPR